ncbi:dTDP-4-dehydrorhamnose 3,5-epimerase [Thermoleptolyngbya sp. PKUAC-SCTB121]|uniref:dTDP-4-dehydrorhamnose 3,5-epimerase n=1 Tax=Thermoleptolyngbya sp. PKUAC-SCTB121 TaxID=2811482 RepID=UPI001964AC45|nr:dTDP-4-dehydrorhamnose 3,5-epimerase [Thermoleptolyngbya sp. PKUAC-SCTB121]
MQITQAEISDVLILEPRLFGDSRGFFYESFNQKVFGDKTSVDAQFVQDNHSRSMQNVLRGLHYQIQQPQGKLVRVIQGAIFDVAVDLRRQSPTFAQWVGWEISAENRRQIWVPPGFAHGFVVLSEAAEVLYKTTDYYAPQHERCIRWDDPDLAIAWPLQSSPILSAKDEAGQPLRMAEVYP